MPNPAMEELLMRSAKSRSTGSDLLKLGRKRIQTKSSLERLRGLIDRLEAQSRSWDERAEYALSIGHQSLAQEAIFRKRRVLRDRETLLSKYQDGVSILRTLEDQLLTGSQKSLLEIAELISELNRRVDCFTDCRESDSARLEVHNLMELGRMIWNCAYPDQVSREQSATTQDWATNIDPWSPEIDEELERLKDKMGLSSGGARSARPKSGNRVEEEVERELQYIKRLIDSL